MPFPRRGQSGRALNLKNVSFCIRRKLQAYPGQAKLPDAPRRANSARRRKWPGKNHHGQADYSPIRSAAGRILLDGIDLREYDLEDLHREIGVIFQDFMRYEMTARENISIGKVSDAGDLRK